MKKLFIIIGCFLVCLPVFSSSSAIDDRGNYYEVLPVLNENGTCSLMLQTTYPDFSVHQEIIPYTELETDSYVCRDHNPFIIFIPDYKKLYLSWVHGTKSLSNVRFISFDTVNQTWGDLVQLSERLLRMRYHPRMYLTQNDDGDGFLHIVWWEEQSYAIGDTVYCVIPRDLDQLAVKKMQCYHMSSFVETSDTTDDTVYSPAAFRFPNIFVSPQDNRAIILAPSPMDSRYNLVEFQLVFEEEDIESNDRPWFPITGVAATVEMNPEISTTSEVSSLFRAGRLLFYWNASDTIKYTLHKDDTWSEILSSSIKELDQKRIDALLSALIQ